MTGIYLVEVEYNDTPGWVLTAKISVISLLIFSLNYFMWIQGDIVAALDRGIIFCQWSLFVDPFCGGHKYENPKYSLSSQS